MSARDRARTAAAQLFQRRALKPGVLIVRCILFIAAIRRPQADIAELSRELVINARTVAKERSRQIVEYWKTAQKSRAPPFLTKSRVS